MGIFDFLFGKKKNAASSQPQDSGASALGGGGALKYDPAIIPRLKQEHQSLLKLFGTITDAYQSGDFSGLKYALLEFQANLNLHLAAENSQFYAYLRKSLGRDTPEHVTMTQFWDEMQEIGKVVTQFLRKYIGCDFTAEEQSTFGAELEQIGAALVSRINREEQSLYSLYAPVRS